MRVATVIALTASVSVACKSDDSSQKETGTETGTETEAVDDEDSSYEVPDQAAATKFERPPFIAKAKFKDLSGPIVLIGAHLKPDAAVQEANWLDDVYAWETREGGSDALILGDLNLDCDYASPAELDSLDLRVQDRFRWLIADDADTNVADSECAYDRAIAAGALLEDAKAKPLESGGDSDHRPIQVTVGKYKVAAFNLRQLGATKVADEGALEFAASLVCDHDVTLLLELIGESEEPANGILSAARTACGDDVELKLSSQVGSTSYKERLAYYYKSSKVELTEASVWAQASAVKDEEDDDTVVDSSADDDDDATVTPPDDDTPSLPAECGVNPYKTPKGYCYATKDGSKKRVAGSCCDGL